MTVLHAWLQKKLSSQQILQRNKIISILLRTQRNLSHSRKFSFGSWQGKIFWISFRKLHKKFLIVNNWRNWILFIYLSEENTFTSITQFADYNLHIPPTPSVQSLIFFTMQDRWWDKRLRMHDWIKCVKATNCSIQGN